MDITEHQVHVNQQRRGETGKASMLHSALLSSRPVCVETSRKEAVAVFREPAVSKRRRNGAPAGGVAGGAVGGRVGSTVPLPTSLSRLADTCSGDVDMSGLEESDRDSMRTELEAKVADQNRKIAMSIHCVCQQREAALPGSETGSSAEVSPRFAFMDVESKLAVDCVQHLRENVNDSMEDSGWMQFPSSANSVMMLSEKGSWPLVSVRETVQAAICSIQADASEDHDVTDNCREQLGQIGRLVAALDAQGPGSAHLCHVVEVLGPGSDTPVLVQNVKLWAREPRNVEWLNTLGLIVVDPDASQPSASVIASMPLLLVDNSISKQLVTARSVTDVFKGLKLERKRWRFDVSVMCAALPCIVKAVASVKGILNPVRSILQDVQIAALQLAAARSEWDSWSQVVVKCPFHRGARNCLFLFSRPAIDGTQEGTCKGTKLERLLKDIGREAGQQLGELTGGSTPELADNEFGKRVRRFRLRCGSTKAKKLLFNVFMLATCEHGCIHGGKLCNDPENKVGQQSVLNMCASPNGPEYPFSWNLVIV